MKGHQSLVQGTLHLYRQYTDLKQTLGRFRFTFTENVNLYHGTIIITIIIINSIIIIIINIIIIIIIITIIIIIVTALLCFSFCFVVFLAIFSIVTVFTSQAMIFRQPSHDLCLNISTRAQFYSKDHRYSTGNHLKKLLYCC